MDIVDRLQNAMHMRSAFIAPQTDEDIEAMRAAKDEIVRLRAEIKMLAMSLRHPD